MMVRSIVIMALLASLFFLVRHLQPVAEPVTTGKAALNTRLEKTQDEGAPSKASTAFNPEVAVPLPDVNNGYIFSEKRKFEKDEPLNAASLAATEPEVDLLASVQYSGSLIAGKTKRALVVYQEQSKEMTPRRTPGSRLLAQAPTQTAAAGSLQKKQLNQGEHFLGYVVATIEPDKIVFEKGDRKVEKFLYDQNKKRLAPPAESSQREEPPTEVGGVPLQALAPPEVLAAMMSPQPVKRTFPKAMVPAAVSGAGGAADSAGKNAVDQKAQVNRMVRRSQRLLGLDSSIDVPLTPVPGLPVPNN